MSTKVLTKEKCLDMCVWVRVWVCGFAGASLRTPADWRTFRFSGFREKVMRRPYVRHRFPLQLVRLQQLLCARPRTERRFDLVRGKDSFWISLINTSSSPSNFSKGFQMWHQSVPVSPDFWGSRGHFHLVLTWVLVIKTTCNQLLFILSIKVSM